MTPSIAEASLKTLQVILEPLLLMIGGASALSDGNNGVSVLKFNGRHEGTMRRYVARLRSA
jgi:hypothetical protein